MKKTYTPEQVSDLICKLNISKRAFCAMVNLNRWTFNRFMRGQCNLSQRVCCNISEVDPKATNEEKWSFYKIFKRMLGM